jgi:oxalyl-CoA decarboxylase
MDSPAMTDEFHLVVDALTLNVIDTIYCVAGILITDFARVAQAEELRYIGSRHEEPAGNAAAATGYLTKRLKRWAYSRGTIVR